ncbi:MAG: substrate-binding domain-containing protein [Firmicutes bacterium]|nr:substrate-binding domain-containing protein [Bacillota bacterium]
MTMKKTVAILLVFAMLFALSACTKPSGPKPDPTPVDPLSEPITLSIDAANLPVIDGALACLPYYEETVALITGLPIDEARTYVLANNTPASFRELAEGTADLGFLLHASQDQVTYAAEFGVTYEYAPYAKDAFVFFVNKDNPVDSVTMQQLKDIYAGRITNWKQVGGKDEPIIAYQRNEGSGSQTGLYQYVISKDEVMDPPTEIRIGDMGGIIDAVALYENASGALGYSYLYFVTNQHYDEDIKLLAVNGFAPDETNIRENKYPMVTEYCLVTRAGEATEGTYLKQIIDWCLSDQGQALAKKLSYIPVSENAPAYVAPALPDMIRTPLHEANYVVNGNHLTYDYVEYRNGSSCEGSYVQISGLKDKTVENKINRTIFNAFFEQIEAEELPNYRGVAFKASKFGGMKPERNGHAWVYADFDNLLSVMVSASRYYDSGDEWFSCGTERGLTFDLRTGELLKITDLFDDPAKGLLYLNGKVQTEIENSDAENEEEYWYWGVGDTPLRLAGSFPGLTEDQNYVLTDYGTISLIFDEKTPWVDLDSYYPVGVGISAMDGISTMKFRTEESLFTDETPVKRLVSNAFPETDTVRVWEWDDDFYGKPNTAHSIDVTYYKSMPAGQIAFLPLGEETKKAFTDRTAETYEQICQENPDMDVQMNSSLNGYVVRVADYTNVYSGESLYMSAYQNGNYRYTIFNESSGRYYVFKGDSTEPMAIEEIFVDGADIPALLKKAAWAGIEQQGEEFVEYAGGWFDRLLDDLYARHLDFGIGSDQLTVYPESMEYSSVYDLVIQYAEGNPLGMAYAYADAIQSPRYDRIGIENLTLFR